MAHPTRDLSARPHAGWTRPRWGTLVVAAALLGLAASRPAWAQNAGDWNQDYDPYVAAIGLAAGYTSGTGLAVRWPAFPQTMLSLAGGAWGSRGDLAWNLGLGADVVLRQVGRLRFLAGPAVALYSNHDHDTTDLNASLGVGVEYLIRTRVSLKTDLGFTWLGGDEKLYPLPQAAVYFYF